MNIPPMLKRLTRPLCSRKVRVALATVGAAFAAEYGLDVGEELILTIVSVGAALILGIAHEDAGRGGTPPVQPAADAKEGGGS